ncbi:MAG: hypothetical protein OEV60_05105 [Actinomycetota bacterium]|nr:hypothetical protein [Actinomycetota bacterium]MDH5223460.1 hypothetical protein [Actinomycetota bacterium]MDH5312534.1 hypothetical protein [Actinomycetota bacterium]
MPTWLGFIWTSPNTLIGLVLGLFTFQLPVVRDGAIIFDKAPRGLTWVMPRLHRTAMTVGFVILSAEPVSGRLLTHERWHIRQFCAWGPLFIPTYFLLALVFGYRRHPMELRAQVAAGERPSAGRDRPPTRLEG